MRKKLFRCIQAILDNMREKGVQTTTSGEVYYLAQEILKKGAPTRREVIAHLVSYQGRLRIKFTRTIAKAPRRQKGAYTINIL